MAEVKSSKLMVAEFHSPLAAAPRHERVAERLLLNAGTPDNVEGNSSKFVIGISLGYYAERLSAYQPKCLYSDYCSAKRHSKIVERKFQQPT
ncbi:hypothetical protein FNV43_RR26569 [Rhamnella rubrinervis]|uniref:Uncharacterized protein n=1 Tax=Rhamnella rubrinervis TaxID=2594499 RepID=A0A8K0GPC6_9ROSA|nr:hypothetical protein FNV43_RR26569 [Rhamnella rubrinervis]